MDPSSTATSDARVRALATWNVIATAVRPGSWLRPTKIFEGPWPGAGPASVWALSQPIAAGVSLVRVGAHEPEALDTMLDVLERYRIYDGYGPYPGDSTRYFDDNAWIGLDFVGLHLATGDPAALAAAERVLAFLRRGEHPDGGIFWVDRDGSPRNTCSTGPTAKLALWVHHLAGDPEALALAERCRDFLTGTLRRDDHLYADKIDRSGHIDHAIYSYNQGTPVGMDVLFHLVTGEDTYLDAATEAARASLAHFGGGDRLWVHEPCFNAIWLRNLVMLDALRPLPGLRPLLEAYAARLWSEARDPATGWFTRGGIGAYGRGGVLDQGGIAQILALPAYSRDLAATLV